MHNPISSDQLSQYWREHIDAWRDSGGSGAAYCQLHQLAYHRFNYWRRKFRGLDSRAQLTPCESTGFARVLASRSDSPMCLSLALPNGLVIQDIGEANVGVVRQLLAVL
jgi:hypothetical protein